MARQPIESIEQPLSRWRSLVPWAMEEPPWLAFIAKLAGALLALAVVVVLLMAQSSWRAGGVEAVIEGTIARTYHCNHRDCHRGRWILYIEGYDGLVSVPLRDVFRRLEAAGRASVRVVVTGDKAREIYLGREQILQRAEAENFERGKNNLMRVAARGLAVAGILAWALTVGLRWTRRRAD